MLDEPVDGERIYNLTKPHYGLLMHGCRTPRSGTHYEPWEPRLHATLAELTEEDVIQMLQEEAWPPVFTGAFFCGIKRWNQFQFDIGRIFLDAERREISDACAFALASFESHASTNYLRRYMNRFLKQDDRWYVVAGMPMAALAWLDHKLGTEHFPDYESRFATFIARQLNLSEMDRQAQFPRRWEREYADLEQRAAASGHTPMSPEEFLRVGPQAPVDGALDAQKVAAEYLRQSREGLWRIMAWCEANGYR